MMGVVVSVNVGLPRDVAWQGRTVRTGIWKQPVTGRVFAGRLNLAGDGQGDLAGHGGEQRAMMVYQLDSPLLGELPWAVGSRARDFRREPHSGGPRRCRGLHRRSLQDWQCRRRGQPASRHLLQARHQAGTSGDAGAAGRAPPARFLFRVIQEGDLGAGDRIEKLSDGPERMTVAEIDALLYSAEHPLEALRRATRIPALSPGWQGSMRKLAAAAEAGGTTGNAGLGPGASAPLAWHGFRPLVIVASREESADVRSFDLAAEDGLPLPPALPGQYILVRVKPARMLPPLRATTHCAVPPGIPTYRIGVKNEHGLASGFLHQGARAGSHLEVGAPRGSFTLAAGAAPVVLITPGVGVTPMLAMLHAAAALTPRRIGTSGGCIRPATGRTIHLRGKRTTACGAPGVTSLRGLQPARTRGHAGRVRSAGSSLAGVASGYGGSPGGRLLPVRSAPLSRGFQKGRVVGMGRSPGRGARGIFGPASALTPGISRVAAVLPHRPDGTAGGIRW